MLAIREWKRVLCIFDVHVPHEDKGCLAIAQAFADDWKPHYVVAGGDWGDTSQVSTFPSEDEIDLADEFDRQKELIESFHVTHWLEGNHEERLRRIGVSNKRLRKLTSPVRNLKLKERGIQIRFYHRKRGVFRFGKLKVLHGFRTNEYVARSTAEAYGCCMFGHSHRFQTHQPKHAFENHTGFAVGCMCRLDLPWADNRPPQGWMQGFSFFYLNPKTRHFSPYMVRLVGGQVVINGKVYARGPRPKKRQVLA